MGVMNDQVPDFRGLHVAAFESRPADDVARLIEKHGGVPHVSPSMRETPLDDHRSAVDFAHRLITGDVDIAVFLTGGGFRERLAIVQRHVGRQRYLNALSDIVTIARGPKPAAAMKEADLTGMTIPPHSGEIRDGKLYGRGASDTRGGIAVAIMAALVLHEFRDQLRGSLTIFSAVDEECNGGGAGAMACLQRLKRRPAPVTGSSPLFTFAVCTDGSGPTVTRGFGGVITGELCVHGQGGHAAAPGGVNAIDKVVIVKGALDAFKQERETAGAGRVNLGIFRAGVHPAVIPAEAVLAFNASTSFTDDSAKVRARFEQLLREHEARDAWLRKHPTSLTWVKDLAAYETPADHWLVRNLASTHQRVLGGPATIDVNPAWSDACWLSREGIPTVNYGPGTPGQAHSDAEHAELSRLVDCCKVLTAFLYEQLRAT